ncbi:hypothetical protein DPMN_012122 [Dreissena polymorpha]|uniref:Uncharacterized protein n=1 Tax=Dreissena polymorpha TaxID=45954 RepID=A0A9D4N1S6_DREPO|nr:hypothetical protein DPMN_012122 [Dreissena polymorpha]
MYQKTAPPPGGHVFPPIMTIFELIRDIYKIDANNVTSRKTHVLTKIHEDRTKNVTSRVFTCFHYIHIVKTSPPPGGHISIKPMNTAPPTGCHLNDDWASNVTSTMFTGFELDRGINRTNVLTKFHEDRTINAASGVFTIQMLTAHDARRTTDKR